MTNSSTLAQPLFDTLESIEQNLAPRPSYFQKVHHDDFEIPRRCLLAYKDSPDTFHSYRREVDRFLQWTFQVGLKDLKQLEQEDIGNYIILSQRSTSSWIATKMVAKGISNITAIPRAARNLYLL